MIKFKKKREDRKAPMLSSDSIEMKRIKYKNGEKCKKYILPKEELIFKKYVKAPLLKYIK